MCCHLFGLEVVKSWSLRHPCPLQFIVSKALAIDLLEQVNELQVIILKGVGN